MDEHEKDCGCEGGCGEGCDCGCEDFPTVKLTLEDSTEIECDIIGTFDVDDNEYIALLPLGKKDVLIYRYEEVDADVKLHTIEEDEEFEKVSEVFYSFYEEDGEDEEDDSEVSEEEI